MRLDDRAPLAGQVSTGAPLALSLAGHWPAGLAATVDGRTTTVVRRSGMIVIEIPAGRHRLELS
jgi:hypothetical protein